MRLPYCILNVLGDVLDDGELNFVEAAQSLDAAKNIGRPAVSPYRFFRT